jgi:hypothetical protein
MMMIRIVMMLIALLQVRNGVAQLLPPEVAGSNFPIQRYKADRE